MKDGSNFSLNVGRVIDVLCLYLLPKYLSIISILLIRVTKKIIFSSWSFRELRRRRRRRRRMDRGDKFWGNVRDSSSMKTVSTML
jgi:hypothetical protein